MKKHRITVYAIWWWDIVTTPGWGEGHREPSLCVSVGVIGERPHEKQRHPVYRIYDSMSNDTLGTCTTIPEANVKCIRRVGVLELPWPAVRLRKS